MSEPPFFIVGAPRSGTTMLQMALNRHSRIVIPPETGFFTLVKRSRRGQRRHWSKLASMLGICVDPPDRRIHPGDTAREHFCRIAAAYVHKLGKPNVTHFGEKTPEHMRRLREIIDTFPESKIVVIYRDGRDVALSLTKVDWMPSDIYLNFFVWLYYYRIQRRFLRMHPFRAICVRYEDLVVRPEHSLSIVLDFLGLPYEKEVAEGSGNQDGLPEHHRSFNGRALERISSTRVGNWRRELSPGVIARLERWGGWALRELQYECITDESTRLPLWHYPNLCNRIAFEVLKRECQRRCDEVFNTSFYSGYRVAATLPVSTSPYENVMSDAPGRDVADNPKD